MICSAGSHVLRASMTCMNTGTAASVEPVLRLLRRDKDEYSTEVLQHWYWTGTGTNDWC